MAVLRAVLLSLGVATSAAADKPLFDYTFGANCPFCVKFGATLKQLYAADGIASSVDFSTHAAIRGSSPNYECPDEDAGCPMTNYALCAAHGIAANDTKHHIEFMACWDEQTESAASKGQKCGEAVGVHADYIGHCATGTGADKLKAAASSYFMKRFPEHVTGPFHVPHIYINGVEQEAIDYDSLLKALCAAGAKGGACGSQNVLVV